MAMFNSYVSLPEGIVELSNYKPAWGAGISQW